MENNLYIPDKGADTGLRFKSEDEAIKEHVDNYKSDGISKGKGTPLASDHYRVTFLVTNTPDDSYVLDVGCNGGTIGVPLMAVNKCYVKGIDVVPSLVKKAVKRGIFAEVGKAEDLSRYKDDEFDVVICAEVLEHLYDPIVAIKEAYRVLKPGGKYLVTIPAPGSEICEDGKLGDYHQQNFSFEQIDTLFHSVFERGKAKMLGIPYSERFCQSNAKSESELKALLSKPQWIGIEAIKSDKISVNNMENKYD